jgi:hypothetical protein
MKKERLFKAVNDAMHCVAPKLIQKMTTEPLSSIPEWDKTKMGSGN